MYLFKKRKENHAESYTFRSSRFDGSGPGLREETPVCPEKLFLTGDKGVLLRGVEEEFGFLTICSFGSLKTNKKEGLKIQSDLYIVIYNKKYIFGVNTISCSWLKPLGFPK